MRKMYRRSRKAKRTRQLAFSSESSSRANDQRKEFVTLWGILLREARCSSNAKCMFPRLAFQTHSTAKNSKFARVDAAGDTVEASNTIPHSVAVLDQAA